MDHYVKGSDIILKQSDFSLSQTLDCGQAFRWAENADGSFSGAFLNTPLTISTLDKNDGTFILHNTTEDEFLNIWYDYFDLSTDYGEIKRILSEDETLKKACDYAGGIRILKQDSWEALSSFIISQNNNIPRIKGIISRLVEHYGRYPSVDDMADETPESLAFLRAGFRAKYLVDAVDKFYTGKLTIDGIKAAPIDEAEKSLMSIKGVGPKVCSCALLFGFYRLEAFPVDVWVRRVLEEYYPNGLPECTKGIEGVAQQYLFHYIRNLYGKVK
ncbi:MAG: DNA glycosylase [Ruminococcus sp.]|nr:DNA glycosylase [Ruminococcus sp.]MBR1753164.1 DNA glycosylase [Ruminococcus sp.]